MRRFLLFIGMMGLAACSGPSSSDVSEHAEGLEAKAVVETVYVARRLFWGSHETV
jgi:hypothetical protein